MPRPEPTIVQRKLDSDELIIRPYMRAIFVVISLAFSVAGLTFLLASEVTIVAIAIAAIVMLAANVIGYILILAKQVEFVHRINSRLDELLESSGLNEYIAGLKQGRADLMQEIEDEDDTT